MVFKDDFNLSETESEYFSGTDETSDESFNEVSDPFYEGDNESNSYDEQILISGSGSSTYEQLIDDDFLVEIKRDDCCSEGEFEISKENGSDVEVMLEGIEEYAEESANENSSDSFDDSDSDYDEEFISSIIRNTKFQLKKMMLSLTPLMMRKS